MKLHWILMFVFCLVFIPVNAQDCGCDHVIGFDVDYIDGASFSPGDVVCVLAGTRIQIVFENLDGTLENPIQIVNCGGQVVINAPVSDFAIEFRNSENFMVDGSFESGIEYGFKLMNATEKAMSFKNLTRYFMVTNIEVTAVNGPAFELRDEPRCDLTANEGFYIAEEINFDHCYVHDTKAGFRLGHPDFGIGVFDELCEILFPYELKNLNISDCLIHDLTGGDGVELYGTSGKVNELKIENIQGNGIFTGTRSCVEIDANDIRRTYFYGIRAEGYSDHKIRNNVFEANGGLGTGSVWVEFFWPMGGGSYENKLEFRHNTAIESGSYQLMIANTDGATAPCYIENNLFAESMVLEPFWSSFGPHFNFEETDLVQVNNNRYEASRNVYDFVDTDAGDFRLTHKSSAINEGVLTGIESDHDGQIRNLAGAPDLGAYEYVPEPISHFGSIDLVGLYVNDFRYILGDEEAETQLLEFAQDSGFNYLLLYNLAYIHYNIADLEDESESALLANFIERAKSDYGMVQVGAVGETDASFYKIEVFNSFNENNWFRTFDVLNMEFEFWTSNEGLMDYYCENYLIDAGHSCTNDGAYDYYEGQLELIDERAHDMGIISEIYIGYPTDEQSTALAERCDRLLLHYYRTSDTYGDGSSIYTYHPNRIRAIALSDRMPAVMPIFSSREYHMGPWLVDHSLHQPMDTWLNGVDGYFSDDSEGVAELPIAGYQWYRYTSFLDAYRLPALTSMAPEMVEDGYDVEMSYYQQSNFINIETKSADFSEAEKYELTVFDLSGRIVASYLVQDIRQTQLALDPLQEGVYLCVLSSGTELIRSQKIMVTF